MSKIDEGGKADKERHPAGQNKMSKHGSTKQREPQTMNK